MMKYRLTEKIGSGGMAEVFRAVGEGPEGFERPFVIKRIHPRLSEAPEFVRMFVDEAKISARLVHPNIVQVFEFAPQDGGYYIVMEPVDGFDMGWLLRRRLESRREVPPPAFVAEVGRQACRGLDFAHTLTGADGKPLGIVHRDVTPPNIMVTWTGTVKIVDFGIARAVEALRTSMTDAGMVKGKMAYVAPELLDGKTADPRSDVFSLGVVMHELLSGRQLFAGENDLDTLRLVREMEIPTPSARNPGVKRALDAIVMRALARDPDKRYQSAGDMGDDLETVVLRERYSTRALARKARELADRDDPDARPVGSLPAPAPAGDAAIEIVDSASMAVPDLGTGVPRAMIATKSAPITGPGSGGIAKRPNATPPRIPAHVAASSKAHAVSSAATASGGALARGRWNTLGIALPSVLAVAILVVLLQRPAGDAGRGAGNPSAPPVSATVRVAIDSVPQGASVAEIVAGVGAGGGLADPVKTPDGGVPLQIVHATRPLGETPLLLDLPRGTAPVALVLTKAGFTPLGYKVIPQQDKDVVARLEAIPPPPPPVAVAVGPLPRPYGTGRHTASARRAQLANGGLRTPGGAPLLARPMATNQPRPPAAAAVPAATATRPALQSTTFRR